jgi:membrane-associated HD superfamily phosphohydrolase
MLHLNGLKLTAGVRLAFVTALFVLSCAIAQAQSCALCYTQAASASHRMIQGLRTGILVLIVPPMFMSVGITVLAYKKRNRTKEGQESLDSRSDW